MTACQVSRDRAGLTLHKWVAVEDPLRERPDGDALGEAPVERTGRLIRQSGFRGREVILALKPPEVSFLTIKAPEALLNSSREQMLTGLKFEAARELQCDPKTLVVDGWRLPEGSRSGDNYMIAAIAEDTVKDWSRFADSTGLLVRRIEVLPSALLRAAPRGDPGEQKSLWGVLDLGYGSCVLTLAKNAHCIYVRQLSVDGDSLTMAIRDALGVDYGTAEILKRQYRPPAQAVRQPVGGVSDQCAELRPMTREELEEQVGLQARYEEPGAPAFAAADADPADVVQELPRVVGAGDREGAQDERDPSR